MPPTRNRPKASRKQNRPAMKRKSVGMPSNSGRQRKKGKNSKSPRQGSKRCPTTSATKKNSPPNSGCAASPTTPAACCDASSSCNTGSGSNGRRRGIRGDRVSPFPCQRVKRPLPGGRGLGRGADSGLKHSVQGENGLPAFSPAGGCRKTILFVIPGMDAGIQLPWKATTTGGIHPCNLDPGIPCREDDDTVKKSAATQAAEPAFTTPSLRGEGRG